VEASGDWTRIGNHVLLDRLRRDRLGEVWRAAGPSAETRVRITPAVDDPDAVIAAVERIAGVRSPAVAPVLDRLIDPDSRRVAVVSPLDAVTLDARRRRGRLPIDAAAALGAVLFDGLAAIHAAGLVHGAVSPSSVGIDEAGTPRWQDAGLAQVLGAATDDRDAAAAFDVTECAALLRDLIRLPPPLERIVDPVAAGVPEAPRRAADLAVAWRAAATEMGLATPPPGSVACIAALLPPPRVRRLPRLPALPAWGRPVAAAVCAVAAVLLPAGSWLLLGTGSPFARVDVYLPHRGEHLQYRYAPIGSTNTATTTLRVADARIVAGVFTVSVVHESGSGAILPLGLTGSTVRVEDSALVRSAAGGPVRDLREPLAPGAEWTDVRRVGASVVTERRTILGPTSLDEPAGHLDRCVAVELSSTTQTPGGPGATAAGTAWYCSGVGLARAVLHIGQDTLVVDLLSVRG
jgi:hypothetical protein